MSATDQPMPPGLLDIDGVAAYLGTRPRHIRRLIAERRIPHHKVGGLIRFRAATIDRWLSDNERGGTTPPPRAPAPPIRSTSRRRSAQNAPPDRVPGQLRLDE